MCLVFSWDFIRKRRIFYLHALFLFGRTVEFLHAAGESGYLREFGTGQTNTF
jgi:hypothetical protein